MSDINSKEGSGLSREEKDRVLAGIIAVGSRRPRTVERVLNVLTFNRKVAEGQGDLANRIIPRNF